MIYSIFRMEYTVRECIKLHSEKIEVFEVIEVSKTSIFSKTSLPLNSGPQGVHYTKRLLIVPNIIRVSPTYELLAYMRAITGS